PVPALAASWTASDDQLHWELKLRPDAAFSDGTSVTSTDVKATLERIARKDSGSSVSDLLELVTGYRSVAVDGTATELAGVVAATPDLLRIELDSPWASLPSALANPAFGVLPKALAEATTFPAIDQASSLVTSGPFRMSKASSNRLTMVPASGVESASRQLDFVLHDDKAASYDALVAGMVDWSEVPPDRVDEAVERFGRSLFRPYVAELFYAFNLRNPKFADVRFREALVRAVDRQSIITEVYDSTVRPMEGVIVEGLAGAQSDPCGGRCDYDPDRARALLAEITAEGAVVPELQIDFEDDATQTAVANAIKDDLAAVGINATLRPKPLADYQQFAVTGEQELFRLGWIAPYPSADGILPPLFQTGFPNNLTGFSSAAVDELLRSARAEPSAAARTTRFQEAERAVLGELPIIPIAQFEIQSVAAKRVRGLVVTATGTFDGRTVSVAPAG
ncbi:MAG: ABC transporter substrate-binding protein, partial [Actinomycetota bacterium]|nr:ABC transporter substrate-binding protein [Actinomycetota bacterium]